MTGYGKAETMLESGKISVEIRSLNGKNADISIKTTLLPKDKELYVRQLVAEGLKRGSIDVFVNFEANAAESAKQINQELVMEYFRQINELSGKLCSEFPNIDMTDSSFFRNGTSIRRKETPRKGEWGGFSRILSYA